MKIQSQNTIPTYENNVISNTIHLNNYYIFCDQKCNFCSYFSFEFVFLKNDFLLLFIIIINFSFKFFYFVSSSIFSLSMHILCPTFGYCTNHPKKTSRHFMLQMWVLQNHSNKTNVYFVTLMQVFHNKIYNFDIFQYNNTSQYISNSYF